MLHLTNIKEIKTNPNNPRLIKDHKFKKLVKSIKEFPEMLKLRPIVVNKEMVVLGGNMRHKACLELKLKDVWIIKAEDLTEKQKKEFVIKDNVGFGEWDWDILANDWETTELKDWGIDVWQPEDGGQFNMFINGDEIKEKEFDENIKIENQCPKCNYEW